MMVAVCWCRSHHPDRLRAKQPNLSPNPNQNHPIIRPIDRPMTRSTKTTASCLLTHALQVPAVVVAVVGQAKRIHVVPPLERLLSFPALRAALARPRLLVARRRARRRISTLWGCARVC
jgi:hypothetical protein